MEDNLFFMKVARCKRCGGILISDKSKRRGYGDSCYQKEMLDRKNEARKEQEKEREPWPHQKTIFDYLK